MSRTPTPPIIPSPFIPRGTTRSLNMVRSQLNDLSMMSGQAGHMAVQRGPLGTNFIDASVDLKGEGGFYGVLVNAGPAGTADFTDARYWVREVSLSQTQGASMTDSVAAYMGASFLNSDGSYGGARWLVATNLLECMVGTHAMTVLPANTPISAVLPPTACIVWVQKIQASKFTNLPQDYGNEVYVFDPVTSVGSTGSTGIIFLVTGNEAGKAKYVAKTFTSPPTGVSSTSDLTASDFGTLAGSNNAMILNPPELAMSNTGHDVTSTYNKFSLYGCGSLLCTNSDGTLVIVAQMFFAGC